MTKRYIPKLMFMVLALFAVAASAADIKQAKRDGLIGERADGYLGLVVKSAPADVVKLVADVNAKRKNEYQRIAKANSLTVDQVQALAGKKAIERTRDGDWIMDSSNWRRK